MRFTFSLLAFPLLTLLLAACGKDNVKSEETASTLPAPSSTSAEARTDWSRLFVLLPCSSIQEARRDWSPVTHPLHKEFCVAGETLLLLNSDSSFRFSDGPGGTFRAEQMARIQQALNQITEGILHAPWTCEPRAARTPDRRVYLMFMNGQEAMIERVEKKTHCFRQDRNTINSIYSVLLPIIADQATYRYGAGEEGRP